MNKILSYIFLSILAIISIGPFLWLLSTALKSPAENIFSYPPVLIPELPSFQNFINVWNSVPFYKYMANSFIVSLFTIILNILLSSLAAYPLAKMQFKGKKLIFYAVLATIMIPFQVIMIPVYLMTLRLNLVDSVSNMAGYAGLILPFSVNAFGIFLMRQAFMAIPKEIEEAAIIDGCNSFSLWRLILLPLTVPTIVTLAIFTFVGSWSEFLWPSIILTKQEMYTLPVGLNHLQGIFSANWRYIAAGAIISMVPIITIFTILQKYFMKGSTQGAVKS